MLHMLLARLNLHACWSHSTAAICFLRMLRCHVCHDHHDLEDSRCGVLVGVQVKPLGSLCPDR